MRICTYCGNEISKNQKTFCSRDCKIKNQTGKKLSEETKHKMKITHTGIKNHFYGKKHSEETKHKIKKKKLGSKHSETTKHKMSKMRKGKKHWNWKGGRRLF